MSEQELASVDPIVSNLLVAIEIDELSELDIANYVATVDQWAEDFYYRCLPHWEPHFHATPNDFQNDLQFFILGMICQYLDLEAGIEYNDEQRTAKEISYTNPSDLFVNGVIDTKRGTCGNMAVLHFAMAWRLGLAASLACAKAHILTRFDDGIVCHNFEATHAGYGGFSSRPDSGYVELYDLPAIAIDCGSDLRALRPHEVLGVYVGLRARHVRDVALIIQGNAGLSDAEPDWLIARHLYPKSRHLFREQIISSAVHGCEFFNKDEAGHPHSLASALCFYQ